MVGPVRQLLGPQGMRTVMVLWVSSSLAACVASAPVGDDYDHDRERNVLGGKADGEPAPRKAWTFLHYGAADNNLAADILQDVNELEVVGSSADVHVVAFLDHAERGASRLYLEQDTDLDTLGSAELTLGDVDSGDPQTLIDFAAWAIESFPADRYALVIGGHGGGDPRVMAPDDKSGNDLSLRELWRALRFVHQATGQRLAVFGGDACLMQTVETAVELAGDADFVVASELTEPGAGWSYDRILAELVTRPDMPTIDLAGEMVEAYRAVYAADEVTLTAVETARVGDLAASLSRLSTALRADPAGAAALSELELRAYRPPYGEGYVDVRGMAELLLARDDLGDAARTAADDVAYDVESPIVARMVTGAALGAARGTSVFWPRRGTIQASTLEAYREAQFADGQWDELVAWFHGMD
jgi:hypothetical protein